MLSVSAVTPSASHLIICSRSLSMRIYSLKSDTTSDHVPMITCELLKTLKPHTSPVVTSAIDPSGTLLAIGGSDGVINVWDIRGAYLTHTFHGHSGVVSALHFFETAAVSRNQRDGVSARNKKKGRRKSKGQQDDEMEDVDETSVATSTVFMLASGGEDSKIRVWDLHKRKSIASLDSHVSIVRGLDFSSKENALASGSRDKTVILWDARTWKVRKVIPILERVECIGFLEGGDLLYIGGESGKIRIWETGSGREVTQEQIAGGEGESIVNILRPPDLPFLLSIHADQTLLLQSLSPLQELPAGGTVEPLPIVRRISGFFDEVIDMAYVNPDKSLLALATNTEDIRLISVSNSTHHSSDATSDSPSPEGHYFGADVALLKGHEDIIICLDVDWSGCWLATGAKDNTARLWRIDQTSSAYTCFTTLKGHAESLGAISLPRTAPPTGSIEYTNPLHHPPPFLLTGSQDKTIKRWNLSNATAAQTEQKPTRAIYTRKAHDKDINAIDINHNSTLFATASQDRTVKIWSTEEGEVQGVLRGHRRGVWSVKFAPKDSPTIMGESGPASGNKGIVLTGSGDKTAKLWSLTDYSCLRTFEGHTNSILKVIWLNPLDSERRDKRGVQVATAGGDGLVKVWDANSAEVECTLDNHEDRVWALAVDRATNTLVSGGGDGTITFWADTTSTTIAASAAASTARVEQEQQLQNFIHAKSYRSAIVLALQLNHPGRLLVLFTSVVNTNPPETGSLSGLVAVDEVLASLAEEQLFKLLLRIRDWNTNARTAPVAQRILWTLVKSYPATSFTGLRNARGRGGIKGGSLKEVLDALKAYTERHYKRMEDLVNESYLIEYTLREMDENAFVNGDGPDAVMEISV